MQSAGLDTPAAPRHATRGSLNARLDGLPWGRFHTIVTCALALGWGLDQFETIIIGSVLGQIKHVWNLTATQGSSLVSSWVLGIFVGAIVFGHYSDLKGRKKMFIFTLIWYAGFSVLTAFSWNFYSLLVLRFLAALGVGGEYSAVTAAMVEFIPTKHRGKASALVLAGASVGAILSSLFAAYFLNHFSEGIGWRLGFGAGGILAIAGIWVRYAVPESPRWLAARGRIREAEEIVDKVEQSLVAAGAEIPPIEEAAAPVAPEVVQKPHTFAHGIRELVSNYLGRLTLACSLNFAQAAVIYGMLAILSLVILPAIGVGPTEMPYYYFVGNVAALGGGLLAAMLVDTLGRNLTVLFGYSMTTIGVICLCFAHTSSSVLVAYSLVMFSVVWATNAAYILSSEILPVGNRATGLGISVSAGRIGAFGAPLLLSAIYQSTQRSMLALVALTVLSLPGPISALIWYLRGTEARNRSLEELSGEPLPLAAAVAD